MALTEEAAWDRDVVVTQGPPVRVDPELCKDCGICVALCPHGVLVAVPGGVRVEKAEACSRCRMCEVHCPDFAIEVVIEGGGAGDRDSDETGEVE
jgi:2-oxoglutarate ferredoxin oxidoreductase subunit delta